MELSSSPPEGASSSKWHAWFASRCPGRRLSTWPTTVVSCPTALGALCAQLTFRLAWCRQHSAVMATELLQPRDLACGTLFQSSCVIPTSPTDCSDGTPFSGSMNTALCDQWRRQKEDVGWVLASVRQPNAKGVRSESPRGRGAETSAEGARVEAP